MDSLQNITLMSKAGAPSRKVPHADPSRTTADGDSTLAGDDFQKSAPVKKSPLLGNISAALNESPHFRALSTEQASAMLLAEDRDIIDLKKVWDFETGGKVYSTGLAAPDGTLYMGSDDGHLHALKDGKKLWEFNSRENWMDTLGCIRAEPVMGPDGIIYIGAENHKVCAVRNGKKVWEYKTGGEIIGAPTLGPDGILYVGSGDKKIYALKDMTLSEKAGRLSRKAPPPEKGSGQKVEEEDGWLIVGGVKLPVNQAIQHMTGTTARRTNR